VFSLSRKLKLNLDSRLVVIFVLRLANPLSENTKQNSSAQVKVMHCVSTVMFMVHDNRCPVYLSEVELDR